MIASNPASSGARSPTRRLCVSASPLRSRSIASGTTTVVSVAGRPLSATNASNSSTMVETEGAKVASMPMREPRPSASWNIASLGFSTGIGTVSISRSMAGPKAEQVTRMPSAPMPAAYTPRLTKRSMVFSDRSVSRARSMVRPSSSRLTISASGHVSAKAAWMGCMATGVAWSSTIRVAMCDLGGAGPDAPTVRGVAWRRARRS